MKALNKIISTTSRLHSQQNMSKKSYNIVDIYQGKQVNDLKTLGANLEDFCKSDDSCDPEKTPDQYLEAMVKWRKKN